MEKGELKMMILKGIISEIGVFTKEIVSCIVDRSLKWNSHQHKLIKRQSCHRIENSQLICPANLLIGFYMMATLAFNELIDFTLSISLISLKVIMISYFKF